MDFPMITNLISQQSAQLSSYTPSRELKNRILVLSSEDKVFSSDPTNQFTLHVRPAVLRARAVTMLGDIIAISTYNMYQ